MLNLASRAVKLGEPGDVLASAAVRAAATGCRCTPIGPQRLKGFDEPIELFRLENAS